MFLKWDQFADVEGIKATPFFFSKIQIKNWGCGLCMGTSEVGIF